MLALLASPAGDDASSCAPAVPEHLFSPLAGFGEVGLGHVEADSGIAPDRQPQHRRGRHRPAGSAFYADFDRRVADEAARLHRLRGRPRRRRHPAAGLRRRVAGAACRRWRSATSPGTGSTASIPRSTGSRPMRCRRSGARMRRRPLALRLPLHGGFEPMAAVTRDIPFIARRSGRDPGPRRARALGLGERSPDRPAVLRRARRRPAARAPGTSAIASRSIDRAARAAGRAALPGSGRRRGRRRQQAGLRDRVGVRGQRARRCSTPRAAASSSTTCLWRKCRASCGAATFRRKICSPAAGRTPIDALLAQPPPPERPRVDGADVAADTIMIW